jgi:hypothetical protein
MRNFLPESRPAGRAMPVIAAAFLSAGVTAICMLFFMQAFSAATVHDLARIMRNTVAETRHQDECEFAMTSKHCMPPLVFDELPDPNEPISI